jgi:hypothetical protein
VDHVVLEITKTRIGILGAGQVPIVMPQQQVDQPPAGIGLHQRQRVDGKVVVRASAVGSAEYRKQGAY